MDFFDNFIYSFAGMLKFEDLTEVNFNLECFAVQSELNVCSDLFV